MDSLGRRRPLVHLLVLPDLRIDRLVPDRGAARTGDPPGGEFRRSRLRRAGRLLVCRAAMPVASDRDRGALARGLGSIPSPDIPVPRRRPGSRRKNWVPAFAGKQIYLIGRRPGG